MAKVVFSFEGVEMPIQCLKENKMKDICSKFSSKINVDINSLYFVYNGTTINFELTFREQANSIDNNRCQMNILAFKFENKGLKCKKCGENLTLPILDELVKKNKYQKDMLFEIKNQIENIINKFDLNNIIRKMQLMKIKLDNLINENERNQKDIQNILNNSINSSNYINRNKLNQSQKFNNLIKIYSDFDSKDEKIIENFIYNSISKYSEYKKIAESIYQNVENWKEGIWTINAGEKDKYNNHTNCSYCISYCIANYKIILSYYPLNSNY